MTISELGKELKKMYETAPEKQKVIFIHLFGIKYSTNIIKNSYSASEIIKASGSSNSVGSSAPTFTSKVLELG